MLIIALCLSLFSCKPSENALQNNAITSEDPSLLEKEKILFINYKISKNPEESYRITMINQIINEGKIKGYNPNIQHLNKGNLKFIQQDNQGNELDSYYVSNPLTKEFEYINEEGEFERKTISLDSSEFGVRLQLHPKCENIATLMIVDSELNTIELLKTQIR